MNVDLFAVIGRLYVENTLLREQNEALAEMLKDKDKDEDKPA